MAETETRQAFEPMTDREGNPVPPLTAIYFYPTERCNLRCPHCWVDPEWVKTPEAYAEKFTGDRAEISVESFQRIVKEAKPLGLGRVKFTGGEPMLRPDLEDFFRALSEEGIRYDIETNGTLVDDARARALKETGCFHVALSLDSPEPSFHDRFRGVEGAWKKTVEGVEHLKRHGHNIQLIMILSRDNEDQLEPMVRFAKDLGVTSLKINPVTPGGRGKGYFEKKGLPVKRLIELLPKAEKEWTEKYKFRVIFSLPIAFHSFDDIANNRIGRCHILNIIGLLSDGSVSICGIGKTEPSLVAGVAGGTPLETIWKEGAVFQSLRKNLPKKLGGACKSCIFKGTCMGYCVANSYTTKGDLFGGYWLCEQANINGSFPESRKSLFFRNKK